MKGLLQGSLENYSWESLRKDLVAGVIVGIIAIPLAMAFAIASGVKPEYGIYTSCIAGIIISVFGGSRFQIGGPTGAFVPILLGIVITYGYEDLLLAGLMAGILLCLMGIFKIGSLIKYIPRPVTIGFTAGIAVIIFTGQISNFLGQTGIEKHEKFIDNMIEIFSHLHTVSIFSIITAIVCLIVILITPKFFPKVPGSIVGLIVSTIIAVVFFQEHIATIGTTYGNIPSNLPEFKIPEITWERIVRLIGPAIAIAALGGIESLLSAVVADGMTGTKHNSNKELVGQGIANIVTPMFGGIPATGAIARTATNIKSGAVSRLSGVIHGVFVLVTVLAFAPYASHIPLASMAPVLMIVAWNMAERKQFVRLLKLRNGDSLVLVVTFLLTVFTSITTAVIAGLILALVLFAKRMSNVSTVEEVFPDHSNLAVNVQHNVVDHAHNSPQISVFTIEGPLFFGVAQLFEQRVMESINYKPKVLILRMDKVPFMDTTGADNFENIISHFKKNGGIVLLTGLIPEFKEQMKASGLYDEIGEKYIFEHTDDAINYALSEVDQEHEQLSSEGAYAEKPTVTQ